MYKKVTIFIGALISMLHVLLVSSYASDIEKVPYIYLSISHGQAMGRMFGRDTIYVGYDGLIQKVKENYGMADTVQKLQEGRLGRKEISRLFSDIDRELTAYFKKGTKAQQKETNRAGQQPVQEYFSPSAVVEMLSVDKKLISANFGGEEEIKQISEIIDNAIAGMTFSDINAERYIRTHLLHNAATIKQYKKDNLIHEVNINDLAQVKAVSLSVNHERRLVPIEGDHPFEPLKFIRWPYKLPYSVEIGVNGQVYSIRYLIKGGGKL